MIVQFDEQERKLLMRAFERSITYGSREEAQAVAALRLRILKQQAQDEKETVNDQA